MKITRRQLMRLVDSYLSEAPNEEGLKAIIEPKKGKFNFPSPGETKLLGALNDLKNHIDSRLFRKTARKLRGKGNFSETLAKEIPQSLEGVAKYNLVAHKNLQSLSQTLSTFLTHAEKVKGYKENRDTMKVFTASKIIKEILKGIEDQVKSAPKPGDVKPKPKAKSEPSKYDKMEALADRLRRVYDGEITLKRGHKNKDEVMAAQEILTMRIKDANLENNPTAKKFLSFGIDGDYGSSTHKLVELIQKHYGIQVDGKIGGQTVRSLFQNRKARELKRSQKELPPGYKPPNRGN